MLWIFFSKIARQACTFRTVSVPLICRKSYVFRTLCQLDSTHRQKYSRLRCLLRVKGLVFCFYFGWSTSVLQFRQNLIKGGSKSWLLTCRSNVPLSQPSYTGSALKRELKKINGYLSLMYFCLRS